MTLTGVSVQSHLVVHSGFSALGEVTLRSCRIGGDVHLDACTFSNLGNRALTLDGARIDGSIVTGDGFSCLGAFGMLSVTVNGSLSLKGTLENRQGRAIIVDGSKIRGGVVLANTLTVTGEVRMTACKVGTQFQVDGQLSNRGADALVLDWLDVTGALIFQSGFVGSGEIRAPGSSIAGQVAVNGGSFENTGGIAFNLEGAKIGSDLVWRPKSVKGTVRLAGAQCRGLRDSGSASWPQTAEWNLDGFKYGRFSDGATTPDFNVRRAWLADQVPYSRSAYREIGNCLPGARRGLTCTTGADGRAQRPPPSFRPILSSRISLGHTTDNWSRLPPSESTSPGSAFSCRHGRCGLHSGAVPGNNNTNA